MPRALWLNAVTVFLKRRTWVQTSPPPLESYEKATMPVPISLLINKSNFVKRAIYNGCGVVQIWLFSVDFDLSSVSQFILME